MPLRLSVTCSDTVGSPLCSLELLRTRPPGLSAGLRGFLVAVI